MAVEDRPCAMVYVPVIRAVYHLCIYVFARRNSLDVFVRDCLVIEYPVHKVFARLV